jgi:transcriptional regulator with XRE-family HTH domain
MTLKEARRLTNLTQQKLEELAVVDRGAVYDLEAGRNRRPSHETVTRVVRALRKSGLPGITSDDIEEFAVEDASERTA